MLTAARISGIVIDGAGVGSAMTANKVPGVRAAACYSVDVARNSREHNDANVLTLGSKTINSEADARDRHRLAFHRDHRRAPPQARRQNRRHPATVPTIGRVITIRVLYDPEYLIVGPPARMLPGMPFSNNGDYELLIEQITDAIVARLNGDGGADQAAMCGCTSECFHRCPERMHRIVDAGAARIGLVLGQTGSAREWASLIDHTLLKPEATDDDIKKLCQEAATYRFASVCVNPTWVRVAACNLRGSGVPVCTVIGFPLGATLPDVKAYEARRAIFDGARGSRHGDQRRRLEERRRLSRRARHPIRAQVAHEYDAICKVIIETALLTDDEKVRACQAAKKAGADFVKTSTGFSKGGATVADVALMRRTVGSGTRRESVRRCQRSRRRAQDG